MSDSVPASRPRATRPARLVALGAVLIGSFLVGGVPVSAAAPARERSDRVEVRTFRFRPSMLTVPTGTKVVWRNRDQIEHTVTGADAAADVIDGRLRRAGASYAVRLDDPGTYEYFCARHPSMTGTVVVR